MENNNNAPTNTTAIVSMENLNQVANWVSATVISAFFSSLERFSCVNVATNDPDDDDNEDEAKVRPLTLSNNSHQGDDVSDLPV
ncbi:hypothetical protein MANES_02G005600v8 [Manihot esculenta]|uniref:Uncharacterized protein n=1 Tax=Manihot esculenta TaxID=3983 RepID=A0A2C9WB74_MANES|nr:hypothetical protein MANES_02G005600v8 [Manihot esculenta]